MKNIMKRITALLLAGMMCFAVTACGNENENEESLAEQTAALNLDDIYECYVTWPSLSGAPADMQMIEDAVNAIVEPKIGVHVTFQPIAISDLASQQQLLISSGEKMDIVVMLWTGLDMWVGTDSLLEIEELIPTYCADIVAEVGDLAYGCKSGDHVYGISAVPGGSAYGFLANSDLLSKYGYDTTDRKITMAELEEMFATIKAGEGTGFYCVADGGDFGVFHRYDNLDGSTYTGAVLIDEDDTQLINLYESKEFEEYANTMYQWAQEGYISADAATTDDSVQTLIATGNYRGAFSASDQEGVKGSYGSSGLIPMTALTIVDGYTKNVDLMDNMFGIASTCENPEKALALINELYTNSEIESILANGIEGTHYQLVEENEKGQKIITFADGLDMMSSGYYVALNVWSMAAADTVWAPSTYAGLDEKKVRASYELSPAFGFVVDASAFSSELTALNAVYNEYNKIINCGAIDPAVELPAFRDALKAADVDKVIAEYQKQYTEWLSLQ
jgi:putative aldouronate transport system substrate-binding protein